MQKTANYNLNKPDGTDVVDISKLNENADIVDSELKKRALITQVTEAQTAAQSYADSKISALVNSAPAALDTLKELADALGDDPNFRTTILNAIATKLNSTAYTAADVLAKLKTVDGSGSGVDADLLDGKDSTAFLQTTQLGVTGGAAKQDDFNAHKLDTAKHLPSGGTVGQVVQKQSNGWGLVDLPPSKDSDNGRYQADFGLEDAVLNDLVLYDSILRLGYINPASIEQIESGGLVNIYGGNGLGQKLLGSFVNFDAINYIDIYAYKIGSPSPLIMTIWDETTSELLATFSVPASSISNTMSWARFQFDKPLPVKRNHILQIRFLSSGSDINNCYKIGRYTLDTQANANTISTSNAWSTITNESGDLGYRINCSFNAITGTATKTYTPTKIKKWGNLKITAANLGANNSATVMVKSNADVQLKAPITLANGDNCIDISDIDSSTYPSLKVVFTLNRNSVSDTSPTISDVSVTYEGKTGGIYFTTGTVSDQAIIPQTPGYKNYLYFVSPMSGSQSSSSYSGSYVSWTISCFVDQLTRVVTAKMGVIISSTPSSIPITANYLEVAWN